LGQRRLCSVHNIGDRRPETCRAQLTLCQPCPTRRLLNASTFPKSLHFISTTPFAKYHQRALFSKLTPSSGDVYAQLHRARITLFSPLLPKPTRPEPRRERHLYLNIVKRPAMQPELGHTPKMSRFTAKLSCLAFLLSLVFAFMSHAGTYTDIGDILSISRSLPNVPPKTRISLVSDSEIETLRHTLS
jgi:hypothetical protein